MTPQRLKRLIKKADLICAWSEAVQLAGFSEDEANRLFGTPPDGTRLRLTPKSVPDAQTAFLKRYAQINKQIEVAA